MHAARQRERRRAPRACECGLRSFVQTLTARARRLGTRTHIVARTPHPLFRAACAPTAERALWSRTSRDDHGPVREWARAKKHLALFYYLWNLQVALGVEGVVEGSGSAEAAVVGCCQGPHHALSGKAHVRIRPRGRPLLAHALHPLRLLSHPGALPPPRAPAFSRLAGGVASQCSSANRYRTRGCVAEGARGCLPRRLTQRRRLAAARCRPARGQTCGARCPRRPPPASCAASAATSTSTPRSCPLHERVAVRGAGSCGACARAPACSDAPWFDCRLRGRERARREWA